MAEFIRRNRRQVAESDRTLVDGLDIAIGNLAGVPGLAREARSIIAALVGAGGTGMGAAQGNRAFAERRHHTDELFARYDDAIVRGDGAAATAALKGVVEIAQASPLGNLADLSQERQALFDREYVHEL